MLTRKVQIPWTGFIKPRGLTDTVVKQMKETGLIAVEIGADAACSNVTPAGFRTMWPCDAHAYSANAPRATPNTSSPGLNRVTLRPTAVTSPARSRPGADRGPVRPNASRAPYGLPFVR